MGGRDGLVKLQLQKLLECVGRGGPMKDLTRISSLGITIFLAITIFISCAAIDRATQPTAKGTPSSGPTIEQAQKEDYKGSKARVAVTKFLDKSAKGKATGEIGDGMAEMLSHALFATNRYIVLERQSLPDVLQEQDLGASGRVSPETAARIGQIEGADLLVLGAITEFEPGTAGAEGKASGRKRNPLDILGSIKTSHVALIVKVVDTKTARIVASEQVEGKAIDIMGLISLGGGELSSVFSGYSKTPMEKAIRIAIEEAVKLIVTKTPPSYYRHSPTPKVTTPPPEIQKPKPEQKPPQPPPSDSLPPTPPPVVSPPPIVPTTPELRITKVTKDIENLRDGPAGKIIGKIRKGASLEVIEEKGNWLHVRLEDGSNAWIWKASTSEGKKTSPPPSSTTAPPKVKGPSPM
jgi:curli biogenesis system outer membrane secretion channel CsgG